MGDFQEEDEKQDMNQKEYAPNNDYHDDFDNESSKNKVEKDTPTINISRLKTLNPFCVRTY